MINTDYLTGLVLTNQEKFTTENTNQALVDKTVGALVATTNTYPELYLNPTFARNVKSIYSNFDLINLGKGVQVSTPKPPNVTQISSSAFYQYNFTSADSENIEYDINTDSFYFSTFFSPDSVSRTQTIAKIKGSDRDITVRLLNSQLQILEGDTVIFYFTETLTTDYWLVSVSIVDGNLYAGVSKQDTGEIFNDFDLGGISITKQKFTKIFIGGESDYFDGQMTNIYFSYNSVNSDKILEVISSNQLLINSMSLITASLKQKTSNLGAAIQRTLLQPNYGYDIRNTSQYTTIVNSKPSLINEVDLYNTNGGYPTVWHEPNLSVNHNLFTNTKTLATQTITLPVGFFEFWFISGTGSITSSNGTGTATNHGAVSFGPSNSRVIEVTSAGTFIFTVSGAVNQASLQHSVTGGLPSNELVYQAVTNQSLEVDFDTPGWQFLFGTLKVSSTRITSRTSLNPDARFNLANTFRSQTLTVTFDAYLPAGGTANLTIDYTDGPGVSVGLTGVRQSFTVNLGNGNTGSAVDFTLSLNATDYIVENLKFTNTEIKSLGLGTALTGGTVVGTNSPTNKNYLDYLNNNLVYVFDSSNNERIETTYSDTTPTNFSAIVTTSLNLGATRNLLSKGSASDRLVVTTAGAVQFSSDTGTVTTADSIIIADTLQVIHVTGEGNAIKIYVDGVDIATTGSVTRTANTSPLLLGRATTSIRGTVNTFNYFANVVHSQAQVTAIYNYLNNKYS